MTSNVPVILVAPVTSSVPPTVILSVTAAESRVDIPETFKAPPKVVAPVPTVNVLLPDTATLLFNVVRPVTSNEPVIFVAPITSNVVLRVVAPVISNSLVIVCVNND